MCWANLDMGLGIGSTLIGAMGQNEAAARQNEAYQRNALAANQNASEQYAQNYLKQIQEEAKAIQEKIANRADVMKAKGTALASTENAGLSTANVLYDLERQGAGKDNITDINLKNAKVQVEADNTAIKNQAQSRIDSVAQATGADPVATAITGLGVVVGAQNAKSQSTTGLGKPTIDVPKWRKPTNYYDVEGHKYA